MNQPIFTDMDKRVFLTTSLSDSNPGELISTIRNAIYDGANGFLIHLERLEEQYFTEENLRRIYAYTQNRPVMSLNYRHGDFSDDDLADGQRISLRAGAGCLDVMGSMFGAGGETELCRDSATVDKQMRYIDEIHKGGAQVLMSSHIYKFHPAEEIIPQMLEMERRGADIVKIAMRAETEEEYEKSVAMTMQMKHELHVPFLHICLGEYGRKHRMFAPMLGSCMILCVQSYTPNGHKDKPLLRAMRDAYNNIDLGMNRF